MRFGTNTNTPAADAEASTAAGATSDKGGWPDEPQTLDQLSAKYDIEYKIPARVPGASLFITKAADRDGKTEHCVENQDLKMFLVPSLG